MSVSFDRFAALTVYQTQVAQATGTPNGSASLQQTDLVGQKFVSRQADGTPGFRIRFLINKNLAGVNQTTSIYIYNLSNKSRTLFQGLNNIVVLEVGYGNSSEVIYKGQISRTRTRKEGPNYVTQIESADGLFAFQNSRVDISYRAGTTKNQLYTTLTDSLAAAQVGVGQISGIPTDGYNRGIVLSGKTLDVLQQLCEKDGLVQTIIDGKVYIIPKGSTTSDDAVLIQQSTGMVGIPEVGDDGRITVRCLMNPQIKPLHKVAIASKFLLSPDTKNTQIQAAQYTALKVIHAGDTVEGDWYTTTEVQG